MTLKDKLFGFKGRIRRQDWWILGIVVGLAQLVVTFAVGSIAMAANLTPPDASLAPFAAMTALPLYLSLPIELAFLWPTLSLSMQRYHDRDRSAWPVVVYYVAIQGIGYIPEWATAWTAALDPMVQTVLSLGWSAAFVVAVAWYLIVLGFLDGTKGPNRFGPSPKGIGGAPLAVFD